MRLLEVGDRRGRRGPEAVADIIRDFCDRRLGKGIVRCHDTPGFIANRIGTFWLQASLNEAVAQNVPVEVADAVMGRPVGIPKTGVFGLIDLVGIDLMPHLAASLLSTLPAGDAYRALHKDFPFVRQMIAAGYTGRKGKGGFYRLDPAAQKTNGGDKVKQAVDLAADGFDEARSYRASVKARLASVAAGKKGLRAVVETPDAGGRYARAVLLRTLAYAASLVPEIADTVAAVDEAMRLGYNWKQGPFEMIDALGPAWLAGQLDAVPELLAKVGAGKFYRVRDGRRQFFGTDGAYHDIVRADGVLLLADLRLRTKPVYKTVSAALWDIGDGVLCVEFTGKMNALDEQVFAVYDEAMRLIDGTTYKALVVYNEGTHFSAGANLGLALFAMGSGLWPEIDALVSGGQETYRKLKFANFPVVAAPAGMALGGGCEILLHADHVQAHAETYCGLVEVGVGLIPGWGGCKEMILRYQERERARYAQDVGVTGQEKIWFSPPTTPMGSVRQAFEAIGTARVAKSAAEAKEIGYLRVTDGITMNRDRLLADAKRKALELAEGYKPPVERADIRLPGPAGRVALDLAVADLVKTGKATPYDVTVSSALADVLSGGADGDWTRPVSESDILALERAQFMALVHNRGTVERIDHMLGTGKPLRN